MPQVTVVTDRGSHNVEIDSPNLSIWGVLEKIQAADPNMSVRYVGPSGAAQALTPAQARETYVQAGGRITQTPKGLVAARRS